MSGVITPKSAIEEREWHLSRFEYALTGGKNTPLTDSAQAFPSLEFVPKDTESLFTIARRAEILIWEPAILALSQNGYEVFQGAIPPLPDRSQLWCMSTSNWIQDPTDAVPFETEQTFNLIICKGRQVLRFGFGWGPNGEPINQCTQMIDGRGRNAKLLASLAFLETKVVTLNQHPSDPRIEKHWRRRNVELPLINTVVLRQRESLPVDPDASNIVNWSHRWTVRPHWATRAAGPARQERKQVFIDSYIKGPEDKPLIYKNTIFKASR